MHPLRLLFQFIGAPSLRLVASLFYDRQYLRGRYFDGSLVGWTMVWQGFWTQLIMRRNVHVPWPIGAAVAIDEPKNVIFDVNDMQNFWSHGCYFSNAYGGRIDIGSGTVIAPNVGIVTTNHCIGDPSMHEKPRNVIIGRECWLGMNSIILPGVVLGDRTVVGAGAVVTHSYPAGHVTLVGVPATPIRSIKSRAPVEGGPAATV